MKNKKMDNKRIERLLKIYNPTYKKIRRVLFNLYRPILHDKSNSKLEH